MEQPSSPVYNLRIRELPSSERPRERLRDLGPSALNNAELIAIILRSGTTKQSVLSLASSLVSRHDNLGGLARLSHAELMNEPGIGEAKAAELIALFELARRFGALVPEERPYIRSPQDVHGLLGAEMALFDQEHLRVLLINTRNQVLGVREVYIGNVNSALVRPAEVLREAVRQNAPSIIVVHNHPSGDPAPSPDDIVLTRQLVQAGDLLSIEILDHVVIGDRRFASLKSLGYWPG
ncbi:MAG TPA: DNA repair protein RadC [Rubrobacter sp.]|nr:DNA repair protein RadC [Rubrobacter sp.]